MAKSDVASQLQKLFFYKFKSQSQRNNFMLHILKEKRFFLFACKHPDIKMANGCRKIRYYVVFVAESGAANKDCHTSDEVQCFSNQYCLKTVFLMKSKTVKSAAAF